MKKLAITLLAVFCLFGNLRAFDYKASLTSGVFTGTPFWNQDYIANKDNISINGNFTRLYNRLRFRGHIYDNFYIRVNALRSDNFESANHISETKLYQVYGIYKTKNGHLRAGRFTEFNRWTMGSVDGASFAYNITDKIKVSGYGGVNVQYGTFFDSGNQPSLAYADLAYRGKGIGGKVRALLTDANNLVGANVFKNFGRTGINADIGYDLTRRRINDAGAAINGYVGKKFQWFGNYRLMRARKWNTLSFTDLYERYQVGSLYKLSRNYSMSARFLTTVSDSKTNYLGYLAIQNKYVVLGLNYLAGDSYFNRFGISLGGRYSPIRNLKLSAGIASVDYLINNSDYGYDNIQSLATYFKVKYKAFDRLAFNAYMNYYHNNNVLAQNLRGGATVQFYFGTMK